MNLIAPGWIPAERHVNATVAELEEYRLSIPMKKMGEATDVAKMVAFLAGESAGFITGQRISVNGGLTLA